MASRVDNDSSKADIRFWHIAWIAHEEKGTDVSIGTGRDGWIHEIKYDGFRRLSAVCGLKLITAA
jgi:ATP-dependent DNA ligase